MKKLLLATVIISILLIVGNFMLFKAYINRVDEIRIDEVKRILKHARPPVSTESAVVEDQFERLYQRVRMKESTGGLYGLAKTCKSKGMVNSIGYMAGKGFCFDSELDEISTFRLWIKKHIEEGMTIDQALRHYSNNSYGYNQQLVLK